MNGFLLKEKLLKSQRLLLLVVDALTLLPIIILMLVLSSLKLTGINDVMVLLFFFLGISFTLSDIIYVFFVCNTGFRSIGPAMFEGEALGLEAMYETRTIRVPKPHKASENFLFFSIDMYIFIDLSNNRFLFKSVNRLGHCLQVDLISSWNL